MKNIKTENEILISKIRNLNDIEEKSEKVINDLKDINFKINAEKEILIQEKKKLEENIKFEIEKNKKLLENNKQLIEEKNNLTKEKINLNLERCNATKFGEKYANLLSKDELNNSYCLKDFNLNLTGGFKYDKFSYIRIKIFPCVNKTENNYHCKPQQIIDSYLSSAYFSILIKDIGLNPLNYTNPIIPTFQNLYDTVDSSIYREFLIYFGITEVQTDIGLLTNKVKKNIFLQFRKFYSTFFLRNETEYPNEKEIFVAQIRLEEYIRIQKRLYTKITETFSIIGGYMQLVSTAFTLLSFITNRLIPELKILNEIFNFNLEKKN
jgi:hypothetical protein